MQKTLKVPFFSKVYTISTDVDEQCVMRAVDRLVQLFNSDEKAKGSLSSDNGKIFFLPLLQLAIDLETATDRLQEADVRLASLHQIVSQSL